MKLAERVRATAKRLKDEHGLTTSIRTVDDWREVDTGPSSAVIDVPPAPPNATRNRNLSRGKDAAAGDDATDPDDAGDAA